MIRVVDDNDYLFWFIEQMFVVSIFENVFIDLFVMKFKVMDEDIGSNFRLCYSIIVGVVDLEEDGSRMFCIVEDIGVFQVVRSLDYEIQKQYILKVMVSENVDFWYILGKEYFFFIDCCQQQEIELMV